MMSRTGDVGRLLPLSDLAFNLLVALTDRELHGYALIKELRLRTGRANLRTGTVYAALARLQDDGLIEETGPPEGDRIFSTILRHSPRSGVSVRRPRRSTTKSSSFWRLSSRGTA